MHSIKKGDTVVCIIGTDKTVFRDGRGAGWKLGKLFKVAEVSGTQECQIIWPVGFDDGGVYAPFVKRIINTPFEEFADTSDNDWNNRLQGGI